MMRIFTRFYRLAATPCLKDSPQTIFGVVGGTSNFVCKNNYTKGPTRYLQIDFSNQNYYQTQDDTSFNDNDRRLKAEIECSKPDVVMINNMEELHFWMKIKNIMRKIGYYGQFEDLKCGRGKGVFVRREILDGPRYFHGTVYKSRMPNPS